MSTFNDIDITCEQCGEEFRGTIWTAVHTGQDPELKDLLLGGELNMVMCPSCSHVTYQDHFVLYIDPPAELVAYVYPLSQAAQVDSLRAMMMKGFQEALAVYEGKTMMNYEPVLLFGLEALVEMMQVEQDRAEQSQVAQQICKDHGIAVTMLSPVHARRLQTMRVIPIGNPKDKPTREDVVEGITKLLSLDPALNLYVSLKAEIHAKPTWTL